MNLAEKGMDVLKVWIVTNAYLPQKGGLVSYARNLALDLLKNGNDVEIISSNLKDKSLPSNEKIEGVNISRIDYSDVPILLRPFSPIVYYYRTYKYIKQNNIKDDDIVISRFYTFALAVAMAKSVKRHIFITPLIATRLQYIEVRGTKGIKKLYLLFTLPQLWILDKLAVKKSPLIGVLSKSKKDEVADYYNLGKEKIVVTPPGVNMERFQIATVEEKATIRAQLGYNCEDTIILSVSRLSNEKNLEILIHAMNEIGKSNIKLAIVGEGQCRGDLEYLISKYHLADRVKLWGARHNVEDFYKMADVFCLPSKYEGFGHVYLEALSSGLPVIAARSAPPAVITASDEIIVSDKLGKLVTYSSKEEIIRAIQYCMDISSKDQLYRRDYVKEHFTWKKHFEVIDSLFQ